MKTFLRFTFLLLLIGAVTYFFYLNPFSKRFWSPHSIYEQKLLFSDYSQAEIDEWKLAEQRAMSDSLFVKLPTTIQVGDSSNFSAVAYRFSLNKGEKLVIKILAEEPKEVLFADVFYVRKKGDFKYLESIESDTLELAILQSGDYLIRLQSPINQPISQSLSIYSNPIYDVFPVEGKSNKAIQSFWGASRDGGKRKHEGIDIFAAKGTPILAVCDGKIKSVKNGGLGGKTVWLYDKKLNQSMYYAHLDEQLVNAGQNVKAGDTIGTVGNTGNARTTPPHLHFGIYLGKAIDPLPFVKKQKNDTKSPKYVKIVGRRGMITSKPARMYFAPNKKSKAKSILIKGTIVDIIGATGSYLHIKTADRSSYFVEKRDLKVEQDN